MDWLEDVKREWEEYDEEFENSFIMDIEKHVNMAENVCYLIRKIEQDRERLFSILDGFIDRAERYIEDAENRFDCCDLKFYMGQQKVVEELKKIL